MIPHQDYKVTKKEREEERKKELSKRRIKKNSPIHALAGIHFTKVSTSIDHHPDKLIGSRPCPGHNAPTGQGRQSSPVAPYMLNGHDNEKI